MGGAFSWLCRLAQRLGARLASWARVQGPFVQVLHPRAPAAAPTDWACSTVLITLCAGMCRAHGIPHQRVTAAEDLGTALRSAWGCNRHSGARAGQWGMRRRRASNQCCWG